MVKGIKQVSWSQLVDCGVEPDWATAQLPQINHCLAALPAIDCWQYLSHQLLSPDHPFLLHQLLYQVTFADQDGLSPPPAWIPSAAQMQSTQIAALMRELQIPCYADLHTWSVQNRAEFWHKMIRRLGIRFRQPYRDIIQDAASESPHWLVGARLNIADSCFQADANAPAIVFQAAGKPLSRWTYGDLQSLTHRVANGLVALGFQPGDAIAVALPMTATSVAIYLGIVQAGGVVVSIADSFAAPEIATRLRIAGAKAIFTQDFVQRGQVLPLYAKVVAAAAPLAIVLRSAACPAGLSLELRQGDRTWEEFLSPNAQFTAVAADPDAPTNILFSSGTTGDPKAIPWTHTTPIKCATDGHLHQDIHPGDVVAWPTNLGWMMGPWLIYASLINRATIALYDGNPGDRSFGEFVQNARVNLLGVVPSLVKTWKTTGCMNGLDWRAIKAFSSTGECSNPQDMLFLMSLAGYKPVIEYCGGTEIGGGYITGTLVQPCSPATFTTPALGLEIVILDTDHQPASQGEALIVPPSIGLSTELINGDHHQVYFAQTPSHPLTHQPLRRHGDQIERFPNGYYRAHGRVDDTMNLNGIKVSAAEIEQTLNSVAGICETAAIAIAPPDGGPSQLVIYAVVLPEVLPEVLSNPQWQTTLQTTLQAMLQTALKQQLNPLFKIHAVVVVESLPRTASHKVMRRVLRDRYSQELRHQPAGILPDSAPVSPVVHRTGSIL
ncbi:MAG TPA: AMP-binding protein [Coleofasciculaceae cyanobacterium]